MAVTPSRAKKPRKNGAERRARHFRGKSPHLIILCHQAGGALSVVQLCTECAPAGGYRNSKRD